MKIFIPFFFFLVLFPAPAFAINYYVSPTGSDSNPGSITQPFASITKARDQVRTLLAAGLTENVQIFLRGGNHELASTLVFDSRDSGTASFSITYLAYQGEKPIISLGKHITGWTQNGNIWSTQIPSGWYFRQLFVNGKRAVRARSPNKSDAVPYWTLKSAARPASYPNGIFTLTYDAGKPKRWQTIGSLTANTANAGNEVEIINLRTWGTLRKKVQDVNESTGTVTLKPPHTPGQGFWTNTEYVGNSSFFENAPEMLDNAGEWYFDKATRILKYWPQPGENMQTAEVIAPYSPYGSYSQLTDFRHILTITGTAANPVRNLNFKEIDFAYVDWPLPDIGLDDFQGTQPNDAWTGGTDNTHYLIDTYLMDAAVEAKNLVNSSFDSINVYNTGANGLALLDGCADNVIKNSNFHNIGGNGIMIGTDRPPSQDNPSLTPKRNQIINNNIFVIGEEYQGGIGIWLGFNEGVVVKNNTIHDIPYTGISLGWIWGQGATSAKNNVLEANHIYKVNQLMHDGGAIYMLGSQPGSVLKNNLIHDIGLSKWGQTNGVANTALYWDQGGSNFTVRGNIIYNTQNYNSHQYGPFNLDIGTVEMWDPNASTMVDFGVKSDNYWGVKPGDTGYPMAIAQAAGAKTSAASSPSPVKPNPTGNPGAKPGDATLDGFVDGVDYVVWLNNYNKSAAGSTNGDFDGNGFVDGVDYVIWLNYYGK